MAFLEKMPLKKAIRLVVKSPTLQQKVLPSYGAKESKSDLFPRFKDQKTTFITLNLVNYLGLNSRKGWTNNT